MLDDVDSGGHAKGVSLRIRVSIDISFNFAV